jgi:PAS domain S-box-containing protein
MATEPVRRAAMHAARDIGEAKASGKVTLVQETTVALQPGFLIYVPVYRPGAPTETIAQRRAGLIGFVYAPFRAHDLFRAIFRTSGESPVDIKIYDGSVTTPEHLLYDHGSQAPTVEGRPDPRYQTELRLTVAGRPWTVKIQALPAFALPWATFVPIAILIVGLAFSALVFLMLRASQKEVDASRRTELLLESMNEGVSVTDVDGVIRYTNPAEDRMFGFARGELTGRHVSTQLGYPSEESESIARKILKQLRVTGTWSGELTKKRRDGIPFLTSTRVNALKLANERFYVWVQEDITERKHAEQALRESEARFRGMADQAPVLIWMAGQDRDCVYVNRPWLDFTGQTFTEALKDGWLQCLHPDDRQHWVDAFAVSSDARQWFDMELRMRRHDGVYRWMLTHAIPRFTESAKFLGYIGSCVDIHDRKELEGALRSAIESRDAFLSVASHELRTPLTTLKLQAQLRKRQLETNRGGFSAEKLAQMIETDNRQLDRLARLIDDMLDIARIRTGRLTMQLELVDLCELATDVVDRLRPQVETAGCEISVDCPSVVFGTWDRQRIEQVLINLVINAAKYGAGKPIEVRVHRGGSCARIEVQDHGVGIAPQDRARIFERYERAGDDAPTGGLGLGLYIAQKIVEAHEGTIRLQSELGRGSTFVVELPLHLVPKGRTVDVR